MFPKNKFRGSDRVIIVGSGPSAANFVAPRGVPIIAVNGAIDWLNRASYFFTLDPSPDNMRRVGRGRRRRGVCYCMALPDVKEREVRDGVLCFRRVAERGTEPKIRILPSGGRGAGPHISAFAKMRMKLPAAMVHMVL